MSLEFKKCDLSDLKQLNWIARKTFVDAFQKDNNPADFADYISKAFNEDQVKQELQNPDSSFYFVFSNQILAGYFKLNENSAQTEIRKREGIELERIYVLEDFQGKGLGNGIMHEAVRIAQSKGKEYLWLGVWEHNQGAIRFYNKFGFTKFGEHPYYVGKDKQTDWLMRLDLHTLKAKPS